MKSKNFYDEISEFYEKMINFEQNLELRIKAYKNIFDKPGTAVDIGCGVGLDSIALAKNGHDVTAFDVSPLMIEMVKQNSIKHNVQIKTHVHSYKSIPKQFFNNFNSIVSVGNTIAHLTPRELQPAMKKAYNMLSPGGKLFLHILNYELIVKEKKRINNISSKDGQIIIRFYEFGKNDIDFNILSFESANPKDYKLATTKHYPHKKMEIQEALMNAGFTKIKFAGNFAGDKFDKKKSKDIFIEAVKL